MRGCTVARICPLTHRNLFPAHAGMHRSGPGRRRGPGTVPRACGDAPSGSGLIRNRKPCSPRMRGCTARQRAATGAGQLFPAHAGMHRPTASPATARSSVPRACGDAPGYKSRAARCACCSPRMRGCTSSQSSEYEPSELFPAHAGMHRRSSSCLFSGGAVPRACGDAPRQGDGLVLVPTCSPRMRGCTGITVDNGYRTNLFPAHAGMHRRTSARTHEDSAVPRACGDAPPTNRPALRPWSCSPRMRGCTDTGWTYSGLLELFPAHAGMHRRG